jgi:CelD/BcsL family acetyltransferase involved in cellulose biosynthesis
MDTTFPEFIIKHHSSLQSIGPYKDQWNMLFESMDNPNPFLRFEWFECWLASNMPDDCRVSIVENEGNVVAIVPTRKVTRTFGIFQVAIICPFFDNLADYNDVLVIPGFEKAVIEAFKDLKKEFGWSIAMWRDVRPGSSFERCFKKALGNSWPHIVREGVPCASLSIGDSYENYLKSLSPSRRRYIKRIGERAKRIGEIREIDEKEFSASPRWIEQCIEIEQKSWKGQLGTGIFSDKLQADFFKKLIGRLAEEDRLCFNGIVLEDKLIAYVLGFREKGICFTYSTSYLEEYATNYIGIHNHHALIKQCFTQGTVKTLDTMRGVEKYKLDFIDTVTHNTDYFIFGNIRWKWGWQLAYLGKKTIDNIRTGINKKIQGKQEKEVGGDTSKDTEN